MQSRRQRARVKGEPFDCEKVPMYPRERSPCWLAENGEGANAKVHSRIEGKTLDSYQGTIALLHRLMKSEAQRICSAEEEENFFLSRRRHRLAVELRIDAVFDKELPKRGSETTARDGADWCRRDARGRAGPG